jgi:hypothetical protein
LDAQGGLSGPPVTCLIALNPLNPLAISSVEETLAHEVFHCFQMQILGSMTKASPIARSEKWLIEGGAQWAACQVQSGPVSRGWYRGYLSSPETELFARTYDAIGFFDEVQWATHVDPFKTMRDALLAGNSADAYHKLLDGHDEKFLDDWAASFAQESDRGPEWVSRGPCDQPNPTSPKPVEVSSTGTEHIDTGSLATTIRTLTFTPGDYMLDIKVTRGRARVSASGIDDLISPDGSSDGGGDQYYNVGNGGTSPCYSTAPGGSAPKRLDGGKMPVYIALTGELGGGSATISVVQCPIIREARFTVSNAAFEAKSGDGLTSWTANLNWDVSWNSTSNPSSLPLVVGDYMYANASTMNGGGTYTTTTQSVPPKICSGNLILGGPGTPGDALIKVTGDTTKGKQRIWTLQLRATDYDSFFPDGGTCASPPFGDTAFSSGGHLWEADISLPATGSTVEHTVTLDVASAPSHAPYETWTGTVTLTGTF